MQDAAWERLGAAGGLVYVVMQLTAQSLIQVGGMEPTFGAPAAEIEAFFGARDPTMFAVGGFLSSLSLIPFLWFVGALWRALRRVEPEPAWLSAVAFGSGVATVAVQALAGAGWTLAIFRQDEGLSPEMARFLFDIGNFTFAMTWVLLANLLLAASIVVLRCGGMARWIAWLGVVTGPAMLAAHAVWADPTGMVFLPFTLGWVWFIAASISLMRRTTAS